MSIVPASGLARDGHQTWETQAENQDQRLHWSRQISQSFRFIIVRQSGCRISSRRGLTTSQSIATATDLTSQIQSQPRCADVPGAIISNFGIAVSELSGITAQVRKRSVERFTSCFHLNPLATSALHGYSNYARDKRPRLDC